MNNPIQFIQKSDRPLHYMADGRSKGEIVQKTGGITRWCSNEGGVVQTNTHLFCNAASQCIMGEDLHDVMKQKAFLKDQNRQISTFGQL